MIYVRKTMPGPVDLLEAEKRKASGTYLLDDVINVVKGDFHNKCYLCESTPASINIEHFVAHQSDLDLKFDWRNLFWSCEHCNGTKQHFYNDLLNCIEDVDVGSKLVYRFGCFPIEDVEIDLSDGSVQSVRTRELLLKIFNGTTKLRKIQSSDLRKRIATQLRALTVLIGEFMDERTDDELKQIVGMRIRGDLSDKSEFVSFKRDFIRENRKTLDELRRSIPDFPDF